MKFFINQLSKQHFAVPIWCERKKAKLIFAKMHLSICINGVGRFLLSSVL